MWVIYKVDLSTIKFGWYEKMMQEFYPRLCCVGESESWIACWLLKTSFAEENVGEVERIKMHKEYFVGAL